MVMNTLNVELPEGFKMTELGPLPKEWEVVRVGDVFEFSRKPRNLQVSKDDLIPFIPMESISEESQSIKSWQQRKYSEISSGSFVFKNDIIIAKITPSFENEKQAILDNLPMDFGYATTEIWALHPKDKQAITQHLYNYIKLHPIRISLARKMEGSTGRKRLSRHVLENLLIPLPPLSEQRKIAAVLSSIQEAKEKTEAVISAAKGLKKSMMKYLFTYGPVPVTDAENVPLKETEIGIVPEEWEVIGIKEVIDLRRGVSWRKAEANKEGIGIPVIGIPNIKEDGSIDFANTYFLNKNVKKEKLLQEGDILFVGSSGSIRHVGRNLLIRELPENTFTYASFTFLGRVKQGKAISKFIYYLLNSSHVNFEKYARRASDGKYNFQLTQFKNEQKLPLPPLPEQQKIAFILSAIDEKIEAEESKKQALEDLFRSMLHNLMTAKIRVNNLKIDIDEEL